MALEIERKFLVDKALWDDVKKPEPKEIRQGYIFSNPQKAVRVRIASNKAFLTIKGSISATTRLEYEYEIPVDEAVQMLDTLSESEIAKKRYEIELEGKTWEVDVFEKLNQGLIVAEIELSSEEEEFAKPIWAREEVTKEKKYLNTNLAEFPFCQW